LNFNVIAFIKYILDNEVVNLHIITYGNQEIVSITLIDETIFIVQHFFFNKINNPYLLFYIIQNIILC